MTTGNNPSTPVTKPKVRRLGSVESGERFTYKGEVYEAIGQSNAPDHENTVKVRHVGTGEVSYIGWTARIK